MNKKKATPSYLFLLGGQDLEMQTIRQLLETAGLQENKAFIDRQLGWGAMLSAYQEVLQNTKRTIVGIELREDILPPENYIKIDHHNELDYLPASIVQVAELLGIKLNRWQQLVAANDSGYILAMLEMSASEIEIDAIRRADRAAQGATEADEAAAEQSIETQLTIENGVTVVKSLTDRFSTISDRLFGKTNNRLLIYTDKELNYYGLGKGQLEQLFQAEIKKGKMYAGGGDKGFIGTASGAFDQQQLTEIKEQILNNKHVKPTDGHRTNHDSNS